MRATVGVLFLGAAIGAACSSAPAPPPFKVVADTKLLMDSVLDPAADIVWGSVGSVVTKDGDQELKPKSAEEWTAIRNAAVVVAESGNLLLMAPRVKGPQYGVDWIVLSRNMTDKAEEAMRAADAKNSARLFAVGAELYETCVACHSHYMDAILQVRTPQ